MRRQRGFNPAALHWWLAEIESRKCDNAGEVIAEMVALSDDNGDIPEMFRRYRAEVVWRIA